MTYSLLPPIPIDEMSRQAVNPIGEETSWGGMKNPALASRHHGDLLRSSPSEQDGLKNKARKQWMSLSAIQPAFSTSDGRYHILSVLWRDV